MNKYIPVIIILIFIYFLQSCKPMICPAYQSSFILDDSVRIAKFSLFGPDSLPKEYLTAKTRYGIIETVHIEKRENELKTVEMLTIFPEKIPAPVDTTQTLPFTSPQTDSLQHSSSATSNGK